MSDHPIRFPIPLDPARLVRAAERHGPLRLVGPLGGLDAELRRRAAGFKSFAEAHAALKRLPQLDDRERPRVRRGLEAMYAAAVGLVASLEDALALMVFTGGYYCYDVDFPQLCRATVEAALAYAETPADYARIAETAAIDGTYWFYDLITLADKLAAA